MARWLANFVRTSNTPLSLLTDKASDFLKIGVAAAGRGDLDTLRAVLAERPDWLRRVGSHGRTMLWEAAYRGRLETVAYLLDQGADVDAWGCHFTPLLVDVSPYCAARFKGHDAVAALLLEHGVQVDFHSAIFLGDEQQVRQALDAAPSLATLEKPQHDAAVGATALHYAVSPGHARLVALLLERGADPRPYSDWLLRFCIWRRRADLLEMLIDAGLDAAAAEPPRSGIADRAIADLLQARGLAHGVDHAEGGWPPIVFQCRGDRGGNVQRVRDLLDAGADVNVRNSKGQSALHCAAKAGFVDIVALLLERGAEVDAVDSKGETPLATALRSTVKDKQRLLAVAQMLLAAGADANRSDASGRSPKSIARRKRDRVWRDVL